MAARSNLLILALLCLIGGPAAALPRTAPDPTAAPPAASTCGHRLSPAMQAEWTALGGADGDLGCPSDDEMPGATSPQGSKAEQADFARGMIVWHASGPRAGQTYAVTGCIWRLYFQFGGPSGWLGLPISERQNFPDGQRQSFEGGRITDERATDSCEAEHASDLAADRPARAGAPGAEATSPLDAWLDPVRGDHLSLATASVARTAQEARYQRVGPRARVLDAGGAGTSALKLFWNDARGDHVTTATDEGERDALAGGYEFEASQGFVWTGPHPGALALRQFLDPVSGHHWLTATSEEADAAKAAGFRFVRIEGYAPAP